MTEQRPGQLPRGRHGLSRGFVASNQRDRLLEGVTDATTELGYAATTVADIIRVAGVSRRTFYEHFTDKEECFLAAYDAALERIAERVAIEQAKQEDWPSKIHAGLAAFIDLIVAEPQLGRLCLVEIAAAGPRAIEQRDQALRGFAETLSSEAQAQVTEGVPTPRLAAELVIGGLCQIVYARVAENRAESLLEDLPDLVYAVLLPFCGHEQAHAKSVELSDP